MVWRREFSLCSGNKDRGNRIRLIKVKGECSYEESWGNVV